MHDVEVAAELLNPFAQLANDVISKTKGEFIRIVDLYVKLPRTTESLSQWLEARGQKVSRLLGIISPNVTVPSRLIYTQGYWDFETAIIHPTSEFAKYSFQLQLAYDSDFTELIDTGLSFISLDNLTLNADSYQSATGWTYEKNANLFSDVPSTGVLSGYAGRLVKYTPSNSEFFPSRTVYYIRYRQVNEFGEATSWQTYKQVVGT
jgi:hypothetical protein